MGGALTWVCLLRAEREQHAQVAQDLVHLGLVQRLQRGVRALEANLLRGVGARLKPPVVPDALNRLTY